MTHLACADAPTQRGDDRADGPLRRGDRAARAPRRCVLRSGTRPTARPSCARRRCSTRCGPGSRSSASRQPSEGETLSSELRPVMRVRTEIVAVRDVEAGASVGYGATWRASRSVAHRDPADGLRRRSVAAARRQQPGRRSSQRRHVLVRGKRAPIVGRRVDGHDDDRRHRPAWRQRAGRGRRPRRPGGSAGPGRDRRRARSRRKAARSRGRS